MKTNPIVAWRWLLPLLLLAWLPTTVSAQTVKKPFLCIEKTDGSVQKIEIDDEYPKIYGNTEIDSATGNNINYAKIIYGPNWETENLEIPYTEIKRFYTEFELIDDITGLVKDTEDVTAVYSSNGVQIGSAERLSEMPKGVYLMKKGKQTIKLVKK